MSGRDATVKVRARLVTARFLILRPSHGQRTTARPKELNQTRNEKVNQSEIGSNSLELVKHYGPSCAASRRLHRMIGDGFLDLS
jgi:hypothetical protein